MRIISKFRDYYDSVQAHGSDPKLIYKRESTELMTEARLFPSGYFEKVHESRPYCSLWRTHLSYLCFCGKSYPFFMLEGEPFASGEELLEAFKRKAELNREVREYRRSIEELSYIGVRHKTPTYRSLTTFAERIRGDVIGSDLFQHFRAPVLFVHRIGTWVHTDYSVIVNPRLADFQFFRWFDPFACYQEIAMFLGIQLAQPDIAPQSVGGDDVIARAKGFDDKSFRTQAPGNKKLNRMANKARKKRA